MPLFLLLLLLLLLFVAAFVLLSTSPTSGVAIVVGTLTTSRTGVTAHHTGRCLVVRNGWMFAATGVVVLQSNRCVVGTRHNGSSAEIAIAVVVRGAGGAGAVLAVAV